jgi:anionic cell wall polymer biosynthesis LytR-Cps2A-Psr (LCP) family protein
VVYLVIPNKNYTYDRHRALTNINKLIEKYEKNVFSHSIDEAMDVIVGTDKHPIYDLYKTNPEKYSRDMIEKKEGIHHYYTYDLSNMLTLIDYVGQKVEFKISYISAEDSCDLHFALRKS